MQGETGVATSVRTARNYKGGSVAKAKFDLDYVPKNYEDFYRHYVSVDLSGRSIVGSLMKSIVRYGTEEEMPNLVQDVFTRCLDKRILERFDPTKSNFGGIVFTVVRTIGVNYLARKSRDPLGLLRGGSFIDEDEEWVPGTYHLSRFISLQPGPEAETINKELLEKLVKFATEASLNPRNTRDKNLLSLLSLTYEEYTPKECAEILRVSQTTIVNWLKYLSDVVREKHPRA